MHVLKLLAVLSLSGAAGVGGAVAPALVVNATGFKTEAGHAIVAVYASKDDWLHLDRAVRVERVVIKNGVAQAHFADIAPGTYAVAVIHDENENGKLDTRKLPVPRPTEGVGVSNDAVHGIGPPSWKAASFQLAETVTLTIQMHY